MSRPIEPTGQTFATDASGRVPPLPGAFLWDGRELVVKALLRTWRSTKNDRGDDYLKRHWFALETEGGATIEIYYDREARGRAPRWWLYTIEEE